MEITERKSELFTRCAETERLVLEFQKLAEGQEMSYLIASSIIMVDAQSESGRSITLSAREIARRELKVVIECEAKKGFKRVANNLISDLTSGHRKKIKTRLKRAMQELAAVDATRLTNCSLSKHYAELSWVGALRHFSKQLVVNRISDTATENSQALPVGDVLKMFAK